MLGVFYSYTLPRHRKTLKTNTAPSMRLLWGTLGPGLVMPNFGMFFGNPVLGRNPPRYPSSWPRRGLPRGVPVQEPPPS